MRERGDAHPVGRVRFKVRHFVAQLAGIVRRQAARSRRVRRRAHRIAVGIQLRALDLIPLGIRNRHPRNRDARRRRRVARDIRRRGRRDGHRHDVRSSRYRLVGRTRLHAQLPLTPVIGGGHRMAQGCRVGLAVALIPNLFALGLPILVALAPGVPLHLDIAIREFPALRRVHGRKLKLVAQVGLADVGRSRPGAHPGGGQRLDPLAVIVLRCGDSAFRLAGIGGAHVQAVIGNRTAQIVDRRLIVRLALFRPNDSLVAGQVHLVFAREALRRRVPGNRHAVRPDILHVQVLRLGGVVDDGKGRRCPHGFRNAVRRVALVVKVHHDGLHPHPLRFPRIPRLIGALEVLREPHLVGFGRDEVVEHRVDVLLFAEHPRVLDDMLAVVVVRPVIVHADGRTLMVARKVAHGVFVLPRDSHLAAGSEILLRGRALQAVRVGAHVYAVLLLGVLRVERDFIGVPIHPVAVNLYPVVRVLFALDVHIVALGRDRAP